MHNIMRVVYVWQASDRDECRVGGGRGGLGLIGLSGRGPRMPRDMANVTMA